MTLRARICDVIHSRPGLTELELARVIYGPFAYQELVRAVCRQLLEDGYIVRRGRGGRHDPFTYKWVGRPNSQMPATLRIETLNPDPEICCGSFRCSMQFGDR